MNLSLPSSLQRLADRVPDRERLAGLELPAPLERARTVVRSGLALLTALGWTVLGTSVLGYLVGSRAGWAELRVISWICLVVVLLAGLFVLGRTRVDAVLEVDPPRVAVDQQVVAGVRITNTARTPLLPIELALPVGESVARFLLPTLLSGRSHEETFVLPTSRRGVFEVGPVTTRRGDPLGLMSRDLTWSEVIEVFVRPLMAPLESLAGGLLRDLEGVSTDQISQSDLAFHALREYAPGDDLRHVHWRSSAKVGQLLVRQYMDTRRSHATIVVDNDPASYHSPEDFETAMSVAASVVVRAVLDGFEVTFACGEHMATGSDGSKVLDSCCRAELTAEDLLVTAQRATRYAPDTSLLLVISGTGADFVTLRQAASVFPPEVRRYLLTIDPVAPTSVAEADGVPSLRLKKLGDLPMLLHWSVR